MSGNHLKCRLTKRVQSPNSIPVDFRKLTKVKLQDFLRKRGRSVTGSKAELVQLCEVYKDEPLATAFQAEESKLEEDRRVFSESNLSWASIKTIKPRCFPKYALKAVEDFLISSLVVFEDGDEIDAGTNKPSIRGRRLYASYRFQLVEVATKDDWYLFRSVSGASLKSNEDRRPCVALDRDGSIKVTQCTCQQQADGKCSRVAGLLYLLDDYFLGIEPRIMDQSACTSKPQAWGQGAKTEKNPKPIQETSYEKKKFRPDGLISFDPRAKQLNSLGKRIKLDRFLRDLQGCQSDSSWEDILRFSL